MKQMCYIVCDFLRSKKSLDEYVIPSYAAQLAKDDKQLSYGVVLTVDCADQKREVSNLGKIDKVEVIRNDDLDKEKLITDIASSQKNLKASIPQLTEWIKEKSIHRAA